GRDLHRVGARAEPLRGTPGYPFSRQRERGLSVGIPSVGFIYVISNQVNDKVYVGQTRRGVEERWQQHCSQTRCGSASPLHRAMNKYGLSAFTIETVWEGPA